MDYNVRTCLPTCPDYDPETKMCRKLEDFPEPAKLGKPCPYDVEAANYVENIVEEALAKEGTTRATEWKEEKQEKFKTLIDLAEKVKRLSPVLKKQIYFPTEKDTTAMVFLYFPIPTMIFNSTMKNTLSELFSTADAVFFHEENGQLKIVFSVEQIWKGL